MIVIMLRNSSVRFFSFSDIEVKAPSHNSETVAAATTQASPRKYLSRKMVAAGSFFRNASITKHVSNKTIILGMLSQLHPSSFYVLQHVFSETLLLLFSSSLRFHPIEYL